MAAAFLGRARLRAAFRFEVVERAGAPRLDVTISGDTPALPERGSPLRARRLLELVARRVPGTLYDVAAKCFLFDIAQHDTLVGALLRPVSFLPPFDRLYTESPLSLPPDVEQRKPDESDYAYGNRIVAAKRVEQQSEYAQLREAEVRIDTLPTQLVRYLADPANAVRGPSGASASASASTSAAALACPPHVSPSLWAMLYPYQREGSAFLIARRRALLCDEMGCGKTKQTAVAAMHLHGTHGGVRPIIVVTPSSLKETWRREFSDATDWAGAQRVRVVREAREAAGGAAAFAGASVVIVSYDLTIRPDVLAALLATNPCVVVLEESHNIKNPEVKRTAACVALGTRAPCFFALSGTPALARHYDLYTQLSLVLPRVFSDRAAFGARYCAPTERYIGRGRTVVEYRGAERATELGAVLRTVMVRRLKRDVLAHLPPKRRERVFLSIDDAKKAEVAALRASADALRRSGASLDAANAALQAAVRHTARVKLPAALRYLDETVLRTDDDAGAGAGAGAGVARVARPPKFIVFAHHLEVLDGVEAHLRKRGVRTLRLDGSTPDEQRRTIEERFQAPGSDVDVLILAITAAGVGLTFTAAALVFFFEMHWTFALNNQAEDRVHRISQTQPVTIRYLIASGTTDEFMWAVNAAKYATTAAVLDNERAELRTDCVTAPAAEHIDKKQRI